MAKNKFIWGIIIVLALILIVPNFMKKEAVPPQLIFGDSLAQCNSYRSEDYACSECKLITQDMVNCDSTLNYYLNKYAFIKVEQIPLICSHLVNYKWAQCITGGGYTPPIECANGNTASCTVYIGMGEISCPGVKTCANEIWGTCIKNDANCGIPTTCTGSSTQSCTIETCAGTQTRTCNSGTWSSWGTCAKNDVNCGATTDTTNFLTKEYFGHPLWHILGVIVGLLILLRVIKK